jgi:hypothetical protein
MALEAFELTEKGITRKQMVCAKKEASSKLHTVRVLERLCAVAIAGLL